MNLAILIITCDKYNFIWPKWYYWFKKNFPQIGKLYWVNETIDCPFNEFIQFKINYPLNQWTKIVREAVNQIPEENVLILLDDLFLIKQMRLSEFEKIYSLFSVFKMDSLRILMPSSEHEKTIYTGYPNLYRLKKFSWYLISYSPTIYKKSFLLKCLKWDYSPWDSEIKGTRRLWIKAFFGKKFKIYQYRKDWFINYIIQGKIQNHEIQYKTQSQI